MSNITKRAKGALKRTEFMRQDSSFLKTEDVRRLLNQVARYRMHMETERPHVPSKQNQRLTNIEMTTSDGGRGGGARGGRLGLRARVRGLADAGPRRSTENR